MKHNHLGNGFGFGNNGGMNNQVGGLLFLFCNYCFSLNVEWIQQ